jgi:dCTP diphosphatase
MPPALSGGFLISGAMNLNSLQTKIDQFVSERDWDQFHSLKNLSMALSVESAELLELFQWLKEEEANRIPEDPKKLEALKDELADVFYYLLQISAKSGIDLEQALLDKIDKNAAKYPVEKARGNAKKYNEF